MESVPPVVQGMATAVQELANKWASRYPKLESRLMRAVALVDRVSYIGEGTYQVEGSGEAIYYVSVDLAKGSSMCTCEDSRRGNKCKHRLAVALVHTLARKGS